MIKKSWMMFGFGALLVAGSLAISVSSAFAAPANKGGQDKTKTDISSSANPSVYGQWVTLTATVSPSGNANGTPTGTVTFKHGNTIFETATLNNLGQATFSTNIFAFPITADYAGDNNYKGSSSKST